jgi:hypothetical protein
MKAGSVAGWLAVALLVLSVAPSAGRADWDWRGAVVKWNQMYPLDEMGTLSSTFAVCGQVGAARPGRQALAQNVDSCRCC